MMPLSSYLGFPRCEKYQAAKKLEKRHSKEWRVFQLSVTSRWNEVETTKLVFQTCFARVVVSCHVYQLLLFHLSSMRFWIGWALILYFFQPTSEVKNICDSHLLQYWTKRDTFITVENLHLDQPIRVFWGFFYSMVEFGVNGNEFPSDETKECLFCSPKHLSSSGFTRDLSMHNLRLWPTTWRS